jgi:GNAT superfamily N-acetyltransferase
MPSNKSDTHTQQEHGVTIEFKDATKEDLPFLEQMLYEAVYWRAISQGKNPTINKGLKADGVYRGLENLWQRNGDTAIVATQNGNNIAAATYRFYNNDNAIRGYISNDIPVIWLAVKPEFRRKCIATLLLKYLLEQARSDSISKISLMVSNDNNAKNLYQKCGFTVEKDDGDSSLMIRAL